METCKLKWNGYCAYMDQLKYLWVLLGKRQKGILVKSNRRHNVRMCRYRSDDNPWAQVPQLHRFVDRARRDYGVVRTKRYAKDGSAMSFEDLQAFSLWELSVSDKRSCGLPSENRCASYWRMSAKSNDVGWHGRQERKAAKSGHFQNSFRRAFTTRKRTLPASKKKVLAEPQWENEKRW